MIFYYISDVISFVMFVITYFVEGNLNEAMAEAVDGADVVLVCMSEKYKDSKNCQKGKLLILTKYYYDHCRYFFDWGLMNVGLN